MCISLQVDALNSQVRELENAARDKSRLESLLAAAERLRGDAEDKLRRAVKENEAIQHEVHYVQGKGVQHFCCKSHCCTAAIVTRHITSAGLAVYQSGSLD
jgi:hypothetical protein